MITEYLKKQGYDTPGYAMHGPISNWLSWYRGEVPSFHQYSIYNGIKRVERKRYSLNMAKRVAEDWANLILNNKFRLTADNSFNDALQDILAANRFYLRANRLIELTFALGTGAFVEYRAGGRPVIDYVRADMIYPLSWENGVVKECAFAGCRRKDGKTDTYVQIHVLEKGVYHIKNALLDERGNELPLPAGVSADVDTGARFPLFQIITPNVVNNQSIDSPMGVSIYAGAIDILRGIDLIYDSYMGEFRLGKKRIVVPASMARVEMQQDGGFSPLFDSNDTEFYAMVGLEGDEGQLKEINMELRVAEHDEGLQRGLNLLSSKCGLGNDRYVNKQIGRKTATEILSEKSDLYQNLKKHELLLEDALKGMARALAFLSGSNANAEFSVYFDDALLEDDAAMRQQALLEFQNGLIDATAYHMQVYKLTRRQAAEKVEEIKARSR